MTAFRLRFDAPAQVSADEAASSFFWNSSRGTVIATITPPGDHLGPSIAKLGNITDRNIDFVRIASAIFFADRSVDRKGGGSNWNRREIAVSVPVLDVHAWEAIAHELSEIVGLLTGDTWTFDFTDEPGPQESLAMPTITPERLVLLSGGADSAIGALLSRSQLAEDESHVLISHFSSNQLPATQRTVAAAIADLVPGPTQEHLQVHLGRRTRRLDGEEYKDEQSSRSRSLLFVALGLAVASVHEVPLWIPENGFASLNPPLGRDRLGSLSTRTTHPTFLRDLRAALARVGAHHDLVNPFAAATKGEMFALAADLVGTDKAASLLSGTNSCAHTGQRSYGVSPLESCGVCFGCFVRRASFRSAKLRDDTKYIRADGDPQLAAWLEGHSVERATERFVRKGVSTRDLIAMNLPHDYPLDTALDLCTRGVAELATLFA